MSVYVGALPRPFIGAATTETFIGTALGGFALLLYWLTGPTTSGGEVYVPLADAFLHGRLWIEGRSWLELIPGPDGWFVPLPPVPALTLMPIVAVMGTQPWNTELAPNVPAAIVGAANVVLAYAMLRGYGSSRATALWLVAAFGLSVHWWVAGNGGPHHYAQLCGVLFTLGALNLAVRGRWPLAAGLLMGLAAGSRLPMAFAIPVVMWLYLRGSAPLRAPRNLQLVVAGVIPVALALAAYNMARFGSPIDFGYARIPSGDGIVTDEWWFSEGIMSVSYIPRSIGHMLFDMPVWDGGMLKPTWGGLSIAFAAPWALLALRERTWILWAGVLAVMLPNWMHGSWGFAQFGYRFLLDATPLLMLLMARRQPDRWLALVAGVGAIATAWGYLSLN